MRENSFNSPCLNEEWRDVKGYEGLYRVSKEGKVISVERIVNGRKRRECEMRQKTRFHRPYLWVTLAKEGRSDSYLVHRLVAEAFVQNPNGYTYVNHKDENPSNNNADNLEWCTQKYNCNYGTRTARIKANMPQTKTVYQITMKGMMIAEFPSIQEAARRTGICAGHICDVCKGNREFANGYKWRYADDELSLQAIRNLEEKQKKSKASRKEKFIQNSRCVSQHDLNGNLLKIWRGMREIAEELGYARSNIINCCNGKIQKAYGYIWKYAD